ncbi:MAG: response regulator [Chloroflexi bacterium]|nr:MAG: response regulator [Chloroflexota bacterium]
MPASETSLARVLIAEDDDSLRRLLELRLESEGYEVRCAEDGMEALEIVIKGWTPDVVVCDVMMPRLSGLSVCRELRDHAKTAKVPIILLTARCFDEDIQDVMRLGGITYMSKPFDFMRLTELLSALLHPGQAQQPRVIELTAARTEA